MTAPRTAALALAAGVLTLLPALVGSAAPALAASTSNCPDLDSGRVSVSGNADQITVTAPAGKTIVGYCLKSSGLRGTTGAPYQVALDAPVTSVVLKHRDGGNLNHYSLAYGTAATQPSTQPTQPAATTQPTQPTSQPTSQPTQTTQPTAPTTTQPAQTTQPTATTATQPAQTTQPTTTTTPPTTTPPTQTTPPETPVEPEIPSTPANPPASTAHGFDWDWTYPTPSCSEVTVPYPGNLPGGQSNDVNIRVSTDKGTRVLNFHRNDGFWDGTVGFVYANHPRWPEGVTRYTVRWVQVGGTNFHWQGDVDCVVGKDGTAVAVTEIEGWRTQTSVKKGRSASADAVTVDQAGAEAVVLQRSDSGTWRTVSTVKPDADGDAVVRFPKEKKKGTTVYRLSAPGSESATGAVSAPLRVRVTG